MDTVVTHVEIDSIGDDALTIRWEVEGDPVAVDVSIGTSANHLDHQHEVTVAAGETSLRLARRTGGRQFVSVAAHSGSAAIVAGERRIPFEGVSNFRDLGGYRTRSGQRVRWGQVFRSDALYGMTEGDLAIYHQLGLRAVYDLRGEVECREQPNPMSSRNMPILARSTGDTPITFDGLTSADGERILFDLYVGHIEHAATRIGELFSALAGPDGLPAVFHCQHGKDRTGLAAALLLEALGVDRETILDDYELTARYRLQAQLDKSFDRLVKAGLAPEAIAGVLTTPRWAMSSALEYLDREYGSIEHYLIGPAAMSPADLGRLLDHLLS